MKLACILPIEMGSSPLSLSLGGGGLKLTISKAVLKQAASQQKSVPPPSSSSPLSSTTLFVGPAPTLEVEPSVSGRGSRRGSRGGSRRGTYMYMYSVTLVLPYPQLFLLQN